MAPDVADSVAADTGICKGRDDVDGRQMWRHVQNDAPRLGERQHGDDGETLGHRASLRVEAEIARYGTGPCSVQIDPSPGRLVRGLDGPHRQFAWSTLSSATAWVERFSSAERPRRAARTVRHTSLRSRNSKTRVTCYVRSAAATLARRTSVERSSVTPAGFFAQRLCREAAPGARQSNVLRSLLADRPERRGPVRRPACPWRREG